MHQIFDVEHRQVGSIDAHADGIAAFDRLGRCLGVFQTSLEAVSCIMRHARNPIERDEETEGAERLKLGMTNV